MQSSRFREAHNGFLLRAEAGMPINERCRCGGVSNATLYK